jgi:hypothetical protein
VTVRVLVRRLLHYRVVGGVALLLVGLWKVGRQVGPWVYGLVNGWSTYEFVAEKVRRGALPIAPARDWLSWLVSSAWFPVGVMLVGAVWVATGLYTDTVFRRAQVLAPKLRHFLSLSNRIQRQMIEEPDKAAAVRLYAPQIDREWRAGVGALLAAELPAAQEFVLEKLAPGGLDPYRWELARLQRCTQKLEAVVANLDYWVRVSATVKPAGLGEPT